MVAPSALAAVERVAPMLPQQQAFLFGHLLGGRTDTGVSDLCAVLEGHLDVDAFTAAWSDVVSRHEVLRTAFAWEGVSQPLQVVRREVDVTIPIVDLTDRPEIEHDAAVAAAMDAAPIDLRRAPLWRLVLARRRPDLTEVRWRSHHVLMDGWSFGIVVGELLATYDARCGHRSASVGPAVGPVDYATWLTGSDREAYARYWTDAFREWPGPTHLPSSDVERAAADGEVRLASQRLGSRVASAVAAMARVHRISPATLLFAAWSVVLARQVDGDEVTFGVVTSGRPSGLAGAERMVGTFARTLPLRLDVRWEQPVGTWL